MQPASGNLPAHSMSGPGRVLHSPPIINPSSPTGTSRDEGICVDDDDDALAPVHQEQLSTSCSKDNDAPGSQVARYKNSNARHRRTKTLSSTTNDDEILDTIHIKPEVETPTSSKLAAASSSSSTAVNTASNKKTHPRSESSTPAPEPKRPRPITPVQHQRNKLPPLSPLQMRMDVDINDIDIPGRGSGRSRVKVPPTERRRISVACDSCRHRKIKCLFPPRIPYE